MARGDETREKRQVDGAKGGALSGKRQKVDENSNEVREAKLKVLPEKDIDKDFTLTIKRGKLWAEKYEVEELIRAAVGEAVRWWLFAVAERADMRYVVFEEKKDKEYMLSKKHKLEKCKVFIIDEILLREERMLKVKRREEARKYGRVRGVAGSTAVIVNEEYVWDGSSLTYKKREGRKVKEEKKMEKVQN